jgi:glucose repression regulatory protein TUP1
VSDLLCCRCGFGGIANKRVLTLRPVTRHIQEIEMIRGKVYSLEQQHNQMKAKYVFLSYVPKRACL